MLVTILFLWNYIIVKDSIFQLALNQARTTYKISMQVLNKVKANENISSFTLKDNYQNNIQIKLVNNKSAKSQNKADPWEKKALNSITNTVGEFSEIVQESSSTFFRYLALLNTEEQRLENHQKQEYKIGDIIGGVSISIPYKPFIKSQTNRINKLILVHVVLFLIGLGGIFLFFNRYKEDLKQKNQFTPTFKIKEDSLIKNNKQGNQELKEIDQKTHLGYWTWDFKKNKIVLSDEVNVILGYSSRENLINDYSQILSIIHPDDVNHVNEMLTYSIITGNVCHVECRIVKADGEIRYVQILGEAEYQENEDNHLWHGTILDITKQKLMVKEQLQLQRYLNVITLCRKVLIYATEENKLYQEICETILSVTGHRMIWIGLTNENINEEVEPVACAGYVEGYLDSIIHTWTQNDVRSYGSVGTAIKEKRTVVIDDVETDSSMIPWRQEAIKRGYLSIISFPIIYIESVLGAISIYSGSKNTFTKDESNLLEDIGEDLAHRIVALRTKGERDIALEKYKEAKKIAEEANRTKSSFLANMSHEIRTPMNAILGFAEILNKKYDNPELKYYLNSISLSGKILLNLINDILDISKMDAGKIVINNSHVNIKSVFTDIQQIFSQEIRKKGLEFRIDFISQIPDTLILDENKLRQILLNLVGNSIKFTHKGFIYIIVKIVEKFYESDKVYLTFKVKDSGIGIAQENLEHIFEPFEQHNDIYQKGYSGTGLGLAITKRLVEILNGTISVESQLGLGSQFTVTLNDIEVGSMDYHKHKADIDRYRFDKATILIADNNKLDRELIQGYLDYPDFSFITEDNGDRVLELVKAHKPNLIIMDLNMTNSAGNKVIILLKQEPEVKSIPIIATDLLAINNIEMSSKDLIDIYLQKPFQRLDLILTLTQFLNYSIEEIIEPEVNLNEESRLDLSHLSKVEKRKLLTKLEEKIPESELLLQGLPIQDIRELSINIKELALKYKVPILLEWAEKLYTESTRFDVNSLPNTLKDFKIIIDGLIN